MGLIRKVRGAFQVGRLVFGGQTPGFASLYTNAGAPTDGTSGTLAAIAQPGSMLLDTTNKVLYQNINTQTSPKWVGGPGHVRTFRAKYDFAVDGGAQGAITPVLGATLPDNAVIFHCVINSVAAVTSLGSATVSIGTSAGSSATALIGATAKASLSLDALLVGTPVPQTANTWVKLTAAGNITFTVGTADLTAGVIEVHGQYFAASA